VVEAPSKELTEMAQIDHFCIFPTGKAQNDLAVVDPETWGALQSILSDLIGEKGQITSLPWELLEIDNDRERVGLRGFWNRFFDHLGQPTVVKVDQRFQTRKEGIGNRPE
jgi:hypothetical protein